MNAMRMLSAIIGICVFLGIASAQGIAPLAEQPAVMKAIAPQFPVPDNYYAVGSVIVEIQIDASGVVTKAKAVQGHPFLYSASEKAAQRWLFSPTSAEIKVRTARLIFVFKMVENPISEEDLSTIFMPPYQIEVRRTVQAIETSEP